MWILCYIWLLLLLLLVDSLWLVIVVVAALIAMQLCSFNACWRYGHTDNWSERALKNATAHKTQQQQTLSIFTVVFYTFRFTHFRIPRHLHWLRVFWVSALIALSVLLCTHITFALSLIALSACHLVRSVAGPGPGTRPCPLLTLWLWQPHILPHAQTHEYK